MIRSALVLLSASLVAAQEDGYRVELATDPNNANANVFGAGATTRFYYIGKGRSAIVKPVPTTFAPTQLDVIGACAGAVTLQTRIFYGQSINETDGLNRTDAIDCSEPVTGNCWDRPVKTSPEGGIRWCQREDFSPTSSCRAMRSFLTGNGTFQRFVTLDIRTLTTVGAPIVWPFDVANVATGIDIQYNGHSTVQHDWWMGYTLNVPAGCSYRLRLSWIARAFNPQERHCSAPIDSQFPIEVDGQLPYFANGTEAPRHASQTFGSSTVTVSGLRRDAQSLGGKLTNAYLASNTRYWELGRGPQLELSCLDIHHTAAGLPTAGCVASLAVVPVGQGWSFHLLEVPSCDAFISDLTVAQRRCCSNTLEATCLGDRSGAELENNGIVNITVQPTGSCIWVEESSTCYPNVISTTDLRLGGVLTDKGNGYVFQSNRIHGPRSSSITTEPEVVRGYTGGSQARTWLLRYINSFVPDATVVNSFHEQCNLEVTASWISTTTGGLCEPGTRQTCEAQTNMCLATDPAEYPRFWNLAADTFEVREDLNENYKVCNCLKEKEVCYRGGGCMSTKRYQLILQNCLEAGCGNYCNSGGQIAVSLFTIALIVLTILL